MTETTIQLNTGEQGMVNVKTKKITGELKAFIITAPESVDIKIFSELNYLLLDIYQFRGVEYYPLIIQPKDVRGWGANYSNVPYFLNEHLIIFASGGPNKQVEIKIRYI